MNSSQNVITRRIIRIWKMSYKGHVAHIHATFWSENRKGRDYLRVTGVNGRIILAGS
jgi:hypothetical protein